MITIYEKFLGREITINFNDDEFVRIKKTGEIGEILSTIHNYTFGIKSTTHLVEINGMSQVYKPKELEKLTPEEIELYKNMNKYNI